MSNIRIYSASEQVAIHLSQQISRGERVGDMPGAVVLAAELGVNHKTVDAALNQLEREGVLFGQGSRRPRGISDHAVGMGRRGLKIAILRYEPVDSRVELVMDIFHSLTQAGHFPFYVNKSQTAFGSDLEKIKRYVRKVDADAWLLIAGTYEMIKWFATESKPTFCLFGRFREVNIAGTRMDGKMAYAMIVRKLVKLGHRRIVLLARPERKLPKPGASEQSFLDTLEECGIQVSDYHFPLWRNTKKGFQNCLEQLFRVSPPTAIIADELLLFVAVENFLAQRNIRVPQDVSLINGVPESSFAWRETSVAHCGMAIDQWVKPVLRWASHIHKGKDYRRQIFYEAEYIDGGTVGPCKD